MNVKFIYKFNTNSYLPEKKKQLNHFMICICTDPTRIVTFITKYIHIRIISSYSLQFSSFKLANFCVPVNST